MAPHRLSATVSLGTYPLKTKYKLIRCFLGHNLFVLPVYRHCFLGSPKSGPGWRVVP